MIYILNSLTSKNNNNIVFSVHLFRGGFMLSVVPQNEGEVAEVIDFREVAPLAATKDMFNKNGSLASWVRTLQFIYFITTCIL